MTKILVKQVQPQLMQMPKEGKSIGDFYNIFRNKNKTPGVGVKQRLAALAGMAGKVGAGLSTVNDTMQAMQGGNISAPLGMGYTYEAKDPTSRKISEWADPQATPRANITPVPLPTIPVPLPTSEIPLPPVQPMPQPAPPQQPLTQGHAPLSPVTEEGQPTLFNPAYQKTANVPNTFNQNMMNTNTATLTPIQNPVLQPQQNANVPSNLQQNMMENPDEQNKSFVTALTEKLGADVVYKMTPHEIGTFSAYTLLKLR